MNNQLPQVPVKKKIDVEKFKVLAKKVQVSFEEQKEYLRKKAQEDADRLSSNTLTSP